MSKILQSLPMTVAAGIVLTIIMVFATKELEKVSIECTDEMTEKECVIHMELMEKQVKSPEKTISDIKN